jgi:hypothetical protein
MPMCSTTTTTAKLGYLNSKILPEQANHATNTNFLLEHIRDAHTCRKIKYQITRRCHAQTERAYDESYKCPLSQQLIYLRKPVHRLSRRKWKRRNLHSCESSPTPAPIGSQLEPWAEESPYPLRLHRQPHTTRAQPSRR